MAEETRSNVTVNAESQTEGQGTATEPATPTVEELMARLEQANADRDRYKASVDKLSKSEAETKRQLRARLSEEERISAEQAEAQRIKDEQLEQLIAENNRMKALGAYKSISAEKTVESLIDAVSNADHNAIAQIIEAEKKAAVKEAQAEWLKSRPQANIGSYSTMTADQIMAITDREEKLKAIALNQHLFK